MATTKKTVKKDDTTDKNKSTTTKKKTTAKKKTNVKKEVESTGVVDEFLNTVVGGTITVEEAEKHSESKKIDEQDTDMPSAELPEEIERQLEIIEKETVDTINDSKVKTNDEIREEIDALNERLEKLGLTEETLSNINEITDKIAEKAETKEPHNVVYPPIAEPAEKETPITVDDLRVNLEAKPQQRFTYVNTSMGIKYD
jgi:hypothetical protein